MKKQELIEKYEYELKLLRLQFGEILRTKVYEELLDYLKQLDEPQKPIVPQFVADWYEENKDNLEFNIFDYVYRFDQNAGFDFKDWFDDFNTKPIQTLVNMHQFGYEVEVEEEKQYYVRFKFIEDSYSYLTLIKHLDAWTLHSITLDKKFRTKHTKKQLEEAGFGEVFNSTLFEVKEAEEW